MKPLKRTGRCKVFLDFDRRAAVTFGPPTRTVEGKLLSNLMKRVPKAPPKENQTNQQRNASEAERKLRVHFTNYVEELTSLKRSKQSKRQSGNPNTISREELQSTAQRYDKKLQDLREEVNTKTGIGYKIIEVSDRPNKLKVLYQQTVHLLEEEIPKQLQRRNKLVPYQANFVEEHLKEARECKASLDYHWLAYISKGTQPEMNAEQSNATQAVNDSESNNYQTDNPVAQTVQNGATASGQETENVSETSSAKQRREERMKKFDIEFETKIRLEQARFERRKLELEMQMKELETKHQLLEEERELERKVKRTALENDDACSQSTSARDKSPFNWTPKKRDVSDWASRIDNLLTPDRSTARFEVTPEVNRQSHFSRYRSSRERSSSVEDRDVSPRAGLLRYNTGYSGSSSLPKLKLNNFDGNPLEWPEWSSMSIATVDQRPIPDSEKMSHLKTLLTGKARSAISGMGYSGQFYGAAWSILERKFGRPHVIIDAQLESLRKASQVKPHDSTGLISFSFIDQNVQEKLRAQGTDVTLNIAGIHGTKDLKTEKVPLKIKGLHSKVHSIEAFAHPSISLGNTNYNYNKLKQSFNHLSVLPNKSFNLMEVGIILGQDAYELQRPLDYKIGTRSEPFAVLTELGWVVSGPMTGKRRQNVCHFAFTEDVKVAENIQTWWDIETYASKINVVSQSKKELQAQKMLESTTKFTGERYEVGMLWSEPEPNLPNNYSSALGQLYSLERRFQRDPNLKNLYQQSIDTDVEKGFVKILDESEVKGTFGKEWYLPHHPVLNPNKPGKVRRVCNAASKYKEVCLNDKLLAGPDLLHGLIGTIFRFREGRIALTADIESMFLQVQVPEQDRSCLEG